MSFLYPAFLLGAVAVAIPIVLHLLRRDVAPEVPFTAVRLLRRSPIERTRKRRLRDLLLLAARVAALVLLASAFARPYSSGAAAGQQLRIVAIDRSFSMGAPGRFTRALELARAAIDESGRGDRVALIAFDDRADLVAAPGSEADARAALAGLQPGFGGTRFGTLLAKAVETAAGSPGRLIVVTDLQRAGWEDEQQIAIPSALALDVRDAGEAPGNTAVTSVRVEPDRVVASLRNAGSRPVSGRARVLVDGREAAGTAFALEGSESADVPISFRAPARGALAVAVEDPTGYAADNVRYVVRGPQPGTPVLIVGGDTEQATFYLLRALQSAAGDDSFEVREATGVTLSAMRSDELSRRSAIVLLSTRGLDRRAREMVAAFVRSGRGLLLAAAPEIEPSVLSSMMGWPGFRVVEDAPAPPAALSVTDLRHPIFRPFGALAANLGHVRFERTWRVDTEGWEVAARFTDGTPALIERREGEGRVVLFASDVARRWNDFPLHPAFVPFAIESVRHAAGVRDRRSEFLIANAPAESSSRPGVYSLPDGRTVAVNVDPRESATARLTPQEFDAMLERVDVPASRSTEARAVQTEARQGFWRYGLMLMLAALVAESFVGRP